MPARDPYKFPYTRGLPRFETLRAAIAKSLKRPYIGVTQGGSSRRDAGAKVAATNGVVRQPKT